LSNVRSLQLSGNKILIGEYTVDDKAEQQAEQFLTSTHPELMIITTPDGKRQIPLQDILILEQRFQQEKVSVEQEAFERGKKAGYETGLNEGRIEAKKVVASLSGLLTDLTSQRHQLLSEAREEIFNLVLKISKRLTFSAAALDPGITRSIIFGAIDQLLDKTKIKVKVHPDHLPELEQHIDRFRGEDTAIKEFAIESDPRIKVGGCFIETPAGDIDARLDSMYEVIRQSILEGEDEAR
jgi:flagellar assembly protein FliH